MCVYVSAYVKTLFFEGSLTQEIFVHINNLVIYKIVRMYQSNLLWIIILCKTKTLIKIEIAQELAK